MGERYQRWLQIFKQLNEHSPTKEDIELIAPSHIKEEYFKLHPPKKVIPKPMPKVKLRRSFDKRDCLPEPVLKKHRVDVITASASKTIAQTENSLIIRRSPRKHPSSSLIRLTTSKKFNSPSKSGARRNLTSVLESEILQNVEGLSANFIVSENESSANITHNIFQPDEQILRRSPRKHPSSYSEVLLSPQKPLLLSQPIIYRRLSSLLGSVSDIENEKENVSLHSSFGAVNRDVNKKNPDESLQEPNKTCVNGERQPFRDENECSKKRVRGKNENYRRLKMKKCYVREMSSAKKNFRKWRRTRSKR